MSIDLIGATVKGIEGDQVTFGNVTMIVSDYLILEKDGKTYRVGAAPDHQIEVTCFTALYK